MIELKTKLNEIKKSNLVFLMEKNSDLKELDALKLDSKIIEKLHNVIIEAKNIKTSFFL